MMNIDKINEMIDELEVSDETPLNCRTLASLYVVKDFYMKQPNPVESEYRDILPQYKKYIDIKRQYQLDNITTTAVVKQFEQVSKEIKEFIFSLYYNSDFQYERKLIENMIDDIKNDFDKNVRS